MTASAAMHETVPRTALRPSLRPSLRPFIGKLWASTATGQAVGAREHVLPTGQMHLVFRLAGPALRIYEHPDDLLGSTIAAPVVCGVRTAFYAKEAAGTVVSVGVQLLPGAAHALFGVSAAELAGRHTPLPDLWGSRAESLFQQLLEAPDPSRQLALLESALAERLAASPLLRPGVAQAIAACAHPARIDDLVRASGYSHRGFIAQFSQATGVSPKRYACLMRFQAVLAALRMQPATSLSALAHGAGYADQAHMTREFRAMAGVTPSDYRALAPAAAHHVARSSAHKSAPTGQFYSRQPETLDL